MNKFFADKGVQFKQGKMWILYQKYAEKGYTQSVAILYTVGYLFEHREEADHHDLVMTLRNLLFAIREGVF